MINANELRIGNWVYNTCNGNNNACPVEQILDKTVIVHYVYNTMELFYDKYLQPIPLTPEILLACGFKKATDSYGGYLIDIGKGEKMRIVNEDGKGWHWPLHGFCEPNTSSLHQLQNLYFALTGNELTYKPL